MPKLNGRQARFVAEHLVDLDAIQAAIRAGYSAKTASSAGERPLRDVEVAEAVAAAPAERSRRTEVPADRVVLELARERLGRSRERSRLRRSRPMLANVKVDPGPAARPRARGERRAGEFSGTIKRAVSGGGAAVSGGRLSWVVDPPAAPRPDPSPARPAGGPDPLAIPLARAGEALALLDGLAVPAGTGRRGNRLGHALGQARAALRRAAALAVPEGPGGGP